LEGNRIAALPPEIGRLTRLKALHMADPTTRHAYENPIAVPPPEFFSLPKLTALSLNGAAWPEFPAGFRQMKLELFTLISRPDIALTQADKDWASRVPYGDFRVVREELED